MNLDIYQEQILRTAGLVNFHPMREHLLDVYGVNHLIAADVWQNEGTFAASTGFTLAGGATISGGKLNFAAAAGSSCSRAATVVIGKTYRIRGTVDAISGNGILIRMGSTGATQAITTAGPLDVTCVCAGSTASFILAADAAATATLDNVTVQEDWTGTFTDDGCLFNGVSNCLQTTNPVSLGTDKMTVLLDWYPNVYDLANNEIMVELSKDFSATNTNHTFILYAGGGDANDPLTMGARGAGTVYNIAAYSNATFGWSTPAWHNLAYTHDKSLATNEANLILNGALATPSARTYNSNLSGNFNDHTLYVGGRGGIAYFGNSTKKNLAVFNRILSVPELAALFHAKSMRRGIHGRSIGRGFIA